MALDRPLRVVVVAPPYFSVPPDGYGGIEAVLALLVDGLAERGHNVTLVGAGEPRTTGDFVATFEEPQAGRLGQMQPELAHAARVEAVLADLDHDVVHDHSAAAPLGAGHRAAPTVVTSHGPVVGEWGEYVTHLSRSTAMVAISEAQRERAPQVRWAGMVHNAVDVAAIPFRTEKEDHVVWLGRFSPDKGAHLAIEVARSAGRSIRLAGKCDEPDEKRYFDEAVAPLLGSDAEYLGVLGAEQKYELLGSAAAFVFPLQWEEPFGMVLLESMACGTPVLSLSRGAVPEVVADGVTGYVRDDESELAPLLDQLDSIDPAACRARVQERFGPHRMVDGYEEIYSSVIEV